MNVSGICQRVIVTISGTASLKEAAISMRENHVGALVVTDDKQPANVVGVVTDRDLVIEALTRDRDIASVRVGEFASAKLVAVAGTASIRDAVAAMTKDGVRRLLVTDGDDRLLGIVSADDLLDAIADEIGGLAAALRSGMARESAQRATQFSGDVQVFLPRALRGLL